MNWRALLLWILVWALPVQAVAAASMRCCGPGHAGATLGVAAAEHAERPAAIAGHGGGAHDPACHEQAAAPSTAADDRGDADPAHGAGCGHCAACCALTVLPTPQAMPGHSAAAPDALRSPPPPVTSHQPEVPHPPPRAAAA